MKVLGLRFGVQGVRYKQLELERSLSEFGVHMHNPTMMQWLTLYGEGLQQLGLGNTENSGQRTEHCSSIMSIRCSAVCARHTLSKTCRDSWFECAVSVQPCNCCYLSVASSHAGTCLLLYSVPAMKKRGN